MKVIKLPPLHIADGLNVNLTSLRPFDYIYSAYDDAAPVQPDPPDTADGAAEIPDPDEESVHSGVGAGAEEGGGNWNGLYATARGLPHGFGSTQRVRIIYDILTSTGEFGCGLNLSKLQEELSGRPEDAHGQPSGKAVTYRQIAGVYALHNIPTVEALRREWLGWDVMPWSAPKSELDETYLDRVRNYLGEKV